jgi:hypothetical protein
MADRTLAINDVHFHPRLRSPPNAFTLAGLPRNGALGWLRRPGLSGVADEGRLIRIREPGRRIVPTPQGDSHQMPAERDR